MFKVARGNNKVDTAFENLVLILEDAKIPYRIVTLDYDNIVIESHPEVVFTFDPKNGSLIEMDVLDQEGVTI